MVQVICFMEMGLLCGTPRTEEWTVSNQQAVHVEVQIISHFNNV
jgi:hypothetical protein